MSWLKKKGSSLQQQLSEALKAQDYLEQDYLLLISLARARTMLEKRLISLATSKNGDLNLRDFMRVVRDLNQITLYEWKVRQRRQRR